MKTHKYDTGKASVGGLLTVLYILAFIGMAQEKTFCAYYDTARVARVVQPENNGLYALGSGSPGFIQGTVTSVGVACGPGTPYRVPPCDGPYPNYEIIVYRADGSTVETRVRSDNNGNYRIALTPGDYVIYTSGGPFTKITNAVTVVSKKTTKLDLVIDTGVRSDVPTGVFRNDH